MFRSVQADARDGHRTDKVTDKGDGGTSGGWPEMLTAWAAVAYDPAVGIADWSHAGAPAPLWLVARPSGRSTTFVVTMRASAKSIWWERFAPRNRGSQRPSQR